MTAGLEAFNWGIISAVSLPLGAFLGLWLRPRLKINSACMAFGAGALLFALSIELFGHVPEQVLEHGTGVLWAAVIGAIIGGLLFDFLNKILNDRGAFLRSLSNARHYVLNLKLRRRSQLVHELGQIRVLEHLEPEQMGKLVQRVVFSSFEPGQIIFKQNDEADIMYFIVSGSVDIVYHSADNSSKKLATLEPNDTFGELGVLSHHPRSADAVAVDRVHVYKIFQRDVDEILAHSVVLQQHLRELSESRIDDLSVKTKQAVDKTWRRDCLQSIESASAVVTKDEILAEGKVVATHSNAALAIWLGILIDGIPESLVIGMLAISAKGMSYAFIAGVFLANLPEAMSSAVSMRNNGMGLKRIYLMWGSICLLTGIGAFLGATLFDANPTGNMYYFIIGIEGLAAGAMLTMIAETMLPEAFEQGGSIVGLSTLGGFLAALIVKIML